jgi:hypothetical protein
MAERIVVFLSHSVGAADQPILARLDAEFQNLGVGVYVAEREFSPTTPTVKIRDAIASSQVVVVLLTSAGTSSAWVNTEVGIALEQGKPIVPLVEEGVEPKGPIKERDQIRFSRDHLEDAVERVTRFIKAVREQAASTEPPSQEEDFAAGVAVGAIVMLVVVLIVVALASRE